MALIELQSSLFFAPSPQPSFIFEDMVMSIRKCLHGLVSFHSPATFIPVPENVQPEIPRVQLFSLDGRFNISISYVSVLLTKNVSDLDSNLEKDYFHQCVKLIAQELIKTYRFSRIGLVYKKAENILSPAKWVYNNYINTSISDEGIIEAAVNIVYRKQTAAFPYNEIINVSNAIINQSKICLLVMRDFNTAHDAIVHVTASTIDELITIAEQSMSNDIISNEHSVS